MKKFVLVTLVFLVSFVPLTTTLAQPIVHYFTVSHDTACYAKRVSFNWHVTGGDSVFLTGPEKVSGDTKLGDEGTIELPVYRSYLYRLSIYFGDTIIKVTRRVIVSCSLPVTDIASVESSMLSVYPNPATDVVTIEFAEVPYKAVLINSLGQVVSEQSSNEVQSVFSVKHLPSGTYFLSVYGETKHEAVRLVH
jgi:hypothetical protein